MKLLLIPSKILFFILDILIPKRELFVVTSKAGKELKGNGSAIFKSLKKQSKREVFFIDQPYTFRSLILLLRTKTVFLTHGSGDVPYAFYAFRKNVVYLGHGIPIKNMLFEDKSVSKKQFLISALESRFYSHVIASSEADKKNLSKIFRLSEDKVYVTGLPRNDHVLDQSASFHKMFDRTGKFVLYAPTYRSYGPTDFFPFQDLDLVSLNETLVKNNVYIVVRSHTNDRGLDRTIFNFSNILNGGNEVMEDIQDYLNNFSSVITDYSSVFIDFLLTDRRLAFIPYDLETYTNRTGLLFDYSEVTPGPHLKSQNDLIKFLVSLNSEEDIYKEERMRVRKIFFKYEDQNSCQRVLDLFK